MRLIDKDKLIEGIKQAFKLNMEGAILSASDMVEAIDQAPTVDTWHYPSKGEYPTDVHDVLCCLRNNNIVSGYYSARDEGWYVEAYGFVDEDNWIKAWMLFPEPPKEER